MRAAPLGLGVRETSCRVEGVFTRNLISVRGSHPMDPHPRGDDMKKSVLLLLSCVVLVGGLLAAGPASVAAGEGSKKILSFGTMVGVPRPYTGNTNAIRGIAGGGLPWVVDQANGKLRADGRIQVDVQGLVLDPNDAAVIAAGLAGTNPIPNFKAIVSCLSRDEAGTTATTVNVETGLFPATTTGDSEIEDTVDLPDPCIAPIVFVTSPTGQWFAATGS
jgi:hypothetical protein